MANKTVKIIKRISISIALLLILGFAVNWYMTHRLQNFLREKLDEKVAEATDGFYDVSFESLSVGLFSGELKLNNLSLAPNPTTFRQWESADSLPETYMNLYIQSIEFKGINLTWVRDYRSLRFDLFEVKSPIVKVFEVYQPNRLKEKENKNTQSKDLYELASPFFDAIEVKKMNLVDADIKYIIEDSINPSVYALENINFFMYNFLLDKNSAVTGKLLYCDNFEFLVEKRQTLLSSPQLSLNADSIRLSTIDSIISIKGIELEPQETLWQKNNTKPEDYIKAKLKSAEVKGIKFTRANAQNELEAHSIDIVSSDIHYYAIKGGANKENDDSDKDSTTKIDSVIQSWSLYSIISPIFNKVAIQNIGIDNTKFQYTVSKGAQSDNYTLNSLNVVTKGFLVDSLSDRRNRFWHSESFELNAANMAGHMPSKNHNIVVGRLTISMQNQFVKIKDIKISPINTSTSLNYINAHVGMVALDKFVIANGFEADKLHLESPTLTYTLVAEPKKATSGKKNSRREKNKNVIDIVSPFLTHLGIKDIKISDADVTFDNRVLDEKYRLQKLNFFMTDFLINKDTHKQSKYYFVFDDFGFNFKDFNNYLPGKDYRLKIQNTSFSYLDGNLLLQNVMLIPQKGLIARGSYIDLKAPLIETKGLKFDETKGTIALSTLKMDSINLEIFKAETKGIANGMYRNENLSSSRIEKGVKKGQTELANQSANDDNTQVDISNSRIQCIDIERLTINKANVRYLNKENGDSLHISTNRLQIKEIAWAEHKSTNIGDITLTNPNVIWAKSEKKVNTKTNISPQKGAEELISLLGKSVKLNTLNITDLDMNISQPNVRINTTIDNIGLSGLNWHLANSSFNMSAFIVNRPSVNIHQKHKAEDANRANSTPSPKGIYEAIGAYVDLVSIDKFDIIEANIDYHFDVDGNRIGEQKINTTNLGFEGLKIDASKKSAELGDLTFNTKNLSVPAPSGLYRFEVGNVELSKKQSSLQVDNLHMIPIYPMLDFAYKNVKHKDWFDISVGNITISGVDIPACLNDEVLIAKKLDVSDVILKNFKNQQIETPKRLSPMIYEKLQKLPLRVTIDSTNVHNFAVVYEELAKNGVSPGKIFFTEMNGKIANLTNIPTRPNQYMRLDADGKLMGTGHFTAIWMIPVDSLNDHFMLNAHLANFDLKELNQLITPLAPAEVSSGFVKHLAFSTSATSIGASIDMTFLYDSLQIIVYKDAEAKTQKKVLTQVANRILKESNFDKKRGNNYRIAETVTERNPYRSTFNYFWQILQPAVIESVGVSQKKQNTAIKAGRFFTKVKSFFSFRKQKQNVIETTETIESKD